MKSLVFLVCFFISSLALADYIRTGPVTGEDCTCIGICSCSKVAIYALGENNDKLYEIAERWKKVRSYNNNRCWVSVAAKSTDLGFLAYGINFFKPNFYTMKNGNYEKVTVQDISFPCVKE